MAAERRTEEDLTALWSAVKKAREAEESRDRSRFGAAQIAFGMAILESAHSLGVRWMANPMVVVGDEILKARPEILIYEPSFADMAESVTEAIANRDPESVRAIADTFFVKANRAVRILLGDPTVVQDDAPSDS